MKIGAQLFSVRTYLETPEKMDELFKAVKEMGYQCVQLSGFPLVKETGAGFDVEFVNSLIEKYNLPVHLTHIAGARLENDLDGVIADHKAIGCSNIGLGGMPGAWDKDRVVDIAFVDAFIAKYEAIAKKIADNGMKFFYHNHHFEFIKLENGQTVLEYLIDNAPSFNFTLDTHWVQRGGASIVGYINKMKGKLECVHLKDFIILSVDKNGNRWTPAFAPVGVGVIDWQEVLTAFEAAGVKYAFVEQDDAVEYDEPLKQIALSASNLIKWGWVK